MARRVTDGPVDRRERRIRRLVRLLQLAVLLLAVATGVLAWREATRPAATAPRLLLAAPGGERQARVVATVRSALEGAQAQVRALEQRNARLEAERAGLEAERDRLRAERERVEARLAELERRLARLEAELASEREAAAGRRARLERERARNQQLWLRLQRAEAELVRARAELEEARRAAAVAEAARVSSAGTGEGSPTGRGTAPSSSATPGTGLRVSDGVEAYRRGDYRRAWEIWLPLAEAGNAKAQFHLGAMLFEGRLGPPDNLAAYVWLERAVRNGYAPAAELRDRMRELLGEEELRQAAERLSS